MNNIYGTYFNDFTIQIIKPLSSEYTDEEYAEIQFNKGFKRVSIITDDLIQTVSFSRENEKKNLYKVEYTVNTTQRKNGTAKEKSYQRYIYIYADNSAEAVDYYNTLTNGKCFYEPKYEASGIKANIAEITETHTPCFMAM